MIATVAGIQGGDPMVGFASGALSSIASSLFGQIAEMNGYSDSNCNLSTFGTRNVGLMTGLTLGFGTIMGGAGAALSGGNFWQGAVTGLVVSGLNHAMHSMKAPEKKAPWDSNGDGILQKSEADKWYYTGKGKGITVDNSKIDWSGLTMPLTGESSFAIQTMDAFKKLPYETASTYGGTSFRRIDSHTAQVLDQDYHYNLRAIGSLLSGQSWSDMGRNVLTVIGQPGYATQLYGGIPIKFASGTPFNIHFSNPTIKFK